MRLEARSSGDRDGPTAGDSGEVPGEAGSSAALRNDNKGAESADGDSVAATRISGARCGAPDSELAVVDCLSSASGMACSISGWAKRELPTEVCSLTARTPRVERSSGPVMQPDWRRKTAAAGSASVVAVEGWGASGEIRGFFAALRMTT